MIRLGEFVTLKRGYDLPKQIRNSGTYPIISSSGTSGLHNEFKVEGPGVVTGRYGTLGEVFYVSGRFWPLNTSLYVQDFKSHDPKFVYYYLQTVLSANFNSAGAVPGVNRNVLHKLAVPEPPKAQKKIAAILSAYDDLIENNKRRIALLEKMAEEIYCEWFVRMRFPGHKKVKFVKGVPEGWEVRPIASISGEIRKGVKKKDLSDSEKYLGLEHIPREQITIIESATGDSVESNKLLFQERDILFAKIRPYLHKVALVHFSGACSSDAIVIRPKSREFEGFLLFTVFSKTFIELATTASKGTKMPRADWDFLKKLEIKIPDDELLEAFQRHFDKAFTQIINLVKSNEILAASRDRLLPRLISGKLCVEDLDIHFPPSMHEQTTAEQLELDFPHA